MPQELKDKIREELIKKMDDISYLNDNNFTHQDTQDIADFFLSQYDSLISSTIKAERELLVEKIIRNQTQVKDPTCLSGAKTRQSEIINLIQSND